MTPFLMRRPKCSRRRAIRRDTRIVRESGWLSVVVALGLAEIGVIQWMEENHIPVDRIAGTSMGSHHRRDVCHGHVARRDSDIR